MGDVVHDEPACLVLWGRYSMIREHALVIMPCSDIIIIIIVLSLDIDYRTRYAIDLCTRKSDSARTRVAAAGKSWPMSS